MKKIKLKAFSNVDKSLCQHSPGIDDLRYVEYSKFCADMHSKGFVSEQCPNCGLWAVFVKTVIKKASVNCGDV